MNKPAAIYARVSSDRQKEDHTIASQTAALVEYAKTNGYVVPPEWVFQDEGYSGASLRSEEHTSELQSRQYLVCRLLLGKKKRRLRLSTPSTSRSSSATPGATTRSSPRSPR